MAVSTVPRPGAVAAVLAKAPTWTPARRKLDGKPFFFIQGSKPDDVWMTAEDGCTCPAANVSKTGDCKHQAAVRQHNERQAKRLGIMTEAEAIVAAAGISADAQARQQAQARLFGTCVSRQGCDQPAGGKSRLCGRHLDALVASLGA